ncbi:MAG: histidine triad nucleotide-binding protein [Gammaproteobacteria bacterium]|uniref:Histidine triad nucleotide-binding protein n=1 Tax=Candidatus Thiopontia autotrophica TaxID=2841688 RepID=A0A8J6NZV1_9GAMM|nr:histidine triad nucleotide-binding protein [Candidatus Thiopontia autotrophica]
MSDDCLFCKMVSGEVPADIVYEDDEIMVFRDIYPKADVHLLMIPKRHTESLATLTAEDDALTSKMVRLLPELAHTQGLDGGFRTIINTGADGGQVIFHLHIHLLGGKNLPGFG